MSVAATEKRPATCTCHDPEVELLRHLIGRGYDQATITRALWCEGESPIANPVTRHLIGRTARQLVRSELKARLPWLRLPRDRDAH